MKRSLKLLFAFMIIAILIFSASQVVFADSGSDLVKGFDGSSSKSSDTAKGESFITTILGDVLSVIRIVAIGIAVIMITYLGIKYMIAAPTEKANIKNQLITFTIGAVVVVGTTSILEIIKNTVQSVTS